MTLETDRIKLKVEEFNELYDEVVLVDFETNSTDTSNSAIQICQNILAGTDKKVIYINHNETGDSLPKIQQLIKEAQIDYYIVITTGQVDEPVTTGMTAFYQDKYFVNGFGSVDLADSLERNIVKNVSGTGNGLMPATKQMDTVIYSGTVSACIYVGSYGNEEEAVMLDSELFWEKLASGLEQVFSEAFEE